MIEPSVDVKTFPLRMQPEFSELVSKAAKKTPLNKHEWIVDAIKEKLEREGVLQKQ